jgi:small-conductance mechanosensitive channel
MAGVFSRALTSLLLALSLTLAAASPAPAPEPVAAPPAELTLANRPIVTLPASVAGIPPAGRVTGIRARLHDLVSQPSRGEVDAKAIDEGYLITVGGEGAFRLLHDDVDPLSDDSLDALRDRTIVNLRLALSEIDEARSLPALLRAVGLTAVATVLLLALLWALRRLGTWIRPRLEAAGIKGMTRAGSAVLAEQAFGQLRAILGIVLILAGWAVGLVALYTWLVFVLKAFPYTRAWGQALGQHLFGTFGDLANGVGRGLPGVIVVVLILLATRWIARVVGRVFDAVQAGTLEVRGLHTDTVPATRRIVIVLLWLFALALAYPFLPGARSAAFQGVTVFAGLMITIGSGAFVGHVLSGYMIIYSRAFRAGDYVRIGDTEGTVLAIGMFTTTVRTLRREIETIPNSVVFSAGVTNYTLSGEPGIVLQAAVAISYRVPWRQVEALLLEAASRTEGIERQPAPLVRQRALSEFAVEYAVHAYLARPELRLATLSRLHASIQDAFNAAGISFVAPHYEADPEIPVLAPKNS